ncbi:MAG: hypothetical protein ABL940_05670 [Bacteroidia bacterium]
MKQILFVLFIFCNSVKGQENIFLAPDKIPNCETMKDGKFKSANYALSDYYMIVANGIQTEYISEGKYYVKSKMEFINTCEYKTTIVEITIPDYDKKVGEFLTTKILETECEYIKVRSRMYDKDYEFVLEKMY